MARSGNSVRFYGLSEGQHGMGVMPEGNVDDFALLRGEIEASEPIHFRHHIGRVPRDMIMGGSPFLLLISDRFRGVLEDNGFTGWATYPVEVRSKRGELIGGYSGLSITGRARPVKGGVPGFLVALARHGAVGLVEQLSTGTDFFVDWKGGSIVITARVRDALRAAKMTNVSYTPFK